MASGERDDPPGQAQPAVPRGAQAAPAAWDAADSPAGSPIPAASALLGPAAILLDAAAALARGRRPAPDAPTFIAGAIGLILIALLIPAATQRGRAFLRRNRTRLAALGFSLTAAVLVGELVVRWVRPEGPQALHLQPAGRTYRQQLRPGVISGIAGDKTMTFNSLGLRGPELPADPSVRRILCVGGSTTLCGYLDDGETWYHLATRTLRESGREEWASVWAAGAARNGANSVNHRVFLEQSRVWLSAEVDCVVCLAGWNDMLSGLAGISDRGLNPRVRYVDPRTQPYFARSALVRLLDDLIEGIKARRRGRAFEMGAGDEAAVVDGAQRQEQRRRRRSAAVVAELPGLDRTAASYENHLRGIIAACREAGVRPVFASQPTMCDSGLSAAARDRCLFGEIPGTGTYLSIEGMRRVIDRLNTVLREVCASEGVEFIDTAAMNGREDLFWDDCHYTEKGARVLAGLVSDHFLRHGPIAANPHRARR